MVVGLDVFRESFNDYTDDYILIGGTACFLLFEEAGLDFRVTKDLDIVLCLEVLGDGFVKKIHDFIRQGKYCYCTRSGNRIYYRFTKPEKPEFPDTLELFSGKPEGIVLDEGQATVPVVINNDPVSLSALLLDEDYRQVILTGKTLVGGIPVVKAEYLLVMKAKAWLDLSERKDKGEQVDSNDVKKHLRDVFRLVRLLNEDMRVTLPDSIQSDLRNFLGQVSAGQPLDLTALGIRTELREIIGVIQDIYRLA